SALAIVVFGPSSFPIKSSPQPTAVKPPLVVGCPPPPPFGQTRNVILRTHGSNTIGSALFHYSWALARRKGFRYDYDARETSWIEHGERQTYKWTASQGAET